MISTTDPVAPTDTERVHTWADASGVWHARVEFPAPGYGPGYLDKHIARIRAKARRAIGRELRARQGDQAVRVRVQVIDSDLDTPYFDQDGPAMPPGGRPVYADLLSVGTTGTPTFQFIVRLGVTAANDITGTIIGSTTATTTNSGVTDGTLWHLSLNIAVSAPGQGANGLTLTSFGGVHSDGFPKGFAGMTITAEPTVTWTAASWNSLLTYYISLSAACSANSGSNKLRVMAQQLWDLNL